MSSVESNYLTRSLKGELGGELGNAETLDFSELHMAWFTRNHPNKDRVNSATQYAHGETSLKSIEGGMPSISLAYLAALEGPVEDIYVQENSCCPDAQRYPKITA